MDGSPPSRLPASVRRGALLRLIGERGHIAVSQVAHEMKVSEMTIRRDLDQLSQSGLVNRNFGGATASDPAVAEAKEPAYTLRDGAAAEAKARIARAAATLVRPGQTIGLDTGSTVHRLAGELSGMSGLRLFSSNLRTASLLASGQSPVYALSGCVRRDELSVYGSTTIAQLRDLWLDTVFIGISGLTGDGLSEYSPEDGDIKRAYMERANRTVVLCDSSKFNRRSLMLVAPLEQCHVLVTEAPPPEGLAAALHRAGVEVVVAD